MFKIFNILFKYRFLLHELVVRDIKVRYKRSVLGLVWTILNPLLMMCIITAVFSNVFRMNIENYAVYLLIGQVVFNLNAEATIQAQMSIFGNSSLIKKVYIPKYLFPLSKVLSALVNFFFAFFALLLVMLITNSEFYVSIFFSIVPLIYLLMFSLGIGLILSAITVYFMDICHLYTVFITAWTYLTPIFYPIDILPYNIRWVVKLNPMYHFIDYFRNLIMYGKIPGINENLICLGIGLLFLSIGVIVFRKLQNNFILHI